MSTEELKLQIFRQVDTLDATRLKEFYGLMINFLNSKNVADEWLGVTEHEQEGINQALKELKEGKGISHQEVMDKLRSKYSHG